MLTCERCIELLDIALDDGLAPGVELGGHLKECAECRRHYQSMKALEDRLGAAARQRSGDAPREISSRALSVFNARNASQAQWRTAPWLKAAACILFVAAAFASYFTFTPTEAPVVKSPEFPNEALPPQALASLDRILRSPDGALLNEREKLLTDVRAAEDFIIHCLPVGDTDNKAPAIKS